MKTLLKTVLDVEKIREDFPILRRTVHGKPLIYFDNAATTQKPLQVIETIREYYLKHNANIHRTVHQLGEEATEAFESARDAVARFINARHREEIVFVRGTTEGINLVSRSWGDKNIGEGERILLSMMEHHSNIVPWQLLSKRTGAFVDYVDIDEDGRLRFDELEQKLTKKTVRLVSVTQASNVLGTINPAEQIAKRAHEVGALAVVDGAQSVPHMPVDVQKMDCDFLAFSGHKMLGPTGVGILYGKRALLEDMDPFLGGGDMIKEVHLEGARWNDLPWKFEAGTSNIADVVGLRAAIDYLTRMGMERVREHEKEITKYALERMSEVKGARVFGSTDGDERGGIISFALGDAHPHDIATILDKEDGIAVRSGHHCAQPLMRRLGVPATSRASFYLYNTVEEVDIFIKALERVRGILGL